MKICKKCNQEIDTKKERYTHIEDWNCEKMEGDSWWHLKCFGEAMNRELTQLEKQAKFMLGKAGTIFNNLPKEMLEKKEEYILR